jgi:hypothetical protein
LEDNSLDVLRGLDPDSPVVAAALSERHRSGEALSELKKAALRSLSLAAPTDTQESSILVTGGTGCIGTEVLSILSQRSRSRIVSVARGLTQPLRVFTTVNYLIADVRDRPSLLKLFQAVRPQIVIHLAAVRNPALAEAYPADTVLTNVQGARNVLLAATMYGADRLVVASTGKALKYWSRDLYAVSKKLVEYLVATGEVPGPTRCAVRFTHVVQNSLILEHLNKWTRHDEPVQLHGLNAFYIQSAYEAAQLLVNEAFNPSPGSATVSAQRDLGWPVDLQELALDVIAANRSSSRIDVVGYPSGYESDLFPGTYDPLTFGDHSPLLNALEVDRITSQVTDPFERCTMPTRSNPDLDRAIDHLASEAALGQQGEALAASARICSDKLLAWHLSNTTASRLKRLTRLAELNPTGSSNDEIVSAAIRRQLRLSSHEPD